MSTWKSVGAKVASFAPLLGTIFGGPIGGAAGSLVKVLAGELGLKDDATPDDFMKAIEVDPAAVLKLKEFEFKHKEELQKLAIEETRIYLQDVQSARVRQAETEKATGKLDLNLYIIAYWFLGGFFTTIIVMIYLLLAGKVPVDVPEFVVFLLGTLFGTLTGGVGAIINYFFGSSKGSADKNAAMMWNRFDKEGK